ncbi:Cytochrome c [Maioricimonas rarisocia]|uniref:Cytochrome c n=1 Tax=Maioricimonas rarisocia TaxID=2528026 RepID=A0A517YZX9_9PLAN|nr:di-heme oxidoredictase family protein [Maioricimonas rarisocia]QDU35781.1 Cytochrome c [Maioricimonas rarisocia]
MSGRVRRQLTQWGGVTLLASYVAWGVAAPGEQNAGLTQTALVSMGADLFKHEWTPNDPLSGGGDGLGPVFNASSCAECHSQGRVGGSGANKHNVQAFEVLPNRHDSDGHVGVVHASAVDDALRETIDTVQSLFPIVPKGKRVIGSCFIEEVDLDPVLFDDVSTPSLFGAGLLDSISDATIRNNIRWRQIRSVGAELAGDFDQTPSGRVRVLPDGRIGKFGWKAQFATLEEFVATACAVEIGLSNPMRKQDRPGAHVPDEDAALDMNQQQLDSLVAFCRFLEKPERVLPVETGARELAIHGEQLFASIGCADCHTPDLGNVKGIYSDLALHRVVNSEERIDYGRIEFDVPIPEANPRPDEWKTPPLWGVADTAPYFHDGRAPTLRDAIAHHHGEALAVKERFDSLSDREQDAVIAFLETLRLPEEEKAPSQHQAKPTPVVAHIVP